METTEPAAGRPRRWMRWLIAAAAGVFVVVAGTMTWMAFAIRPGIEVAAAAPDVTLKSADGEERALSSYRGAFVLLDFWTST